MYTNYIFYYLGICVSSATIKSEREDSNVSTFAAIKSLPHSVCFNVCKG